MTNENPISASEAKAALEQVANIERAENKDIRPPMWLNLLLSLSYGALTFSWAQLDYGRFASVGMFLSGAGFFASLAWYFKITRDKGLKIKLHPKNGSEIKFNLVLAIIFAGVLIIAKEATYQGYVWVSYLGGLINALVLGYTLHNFATGSYISGQK